MYITKVLSNLGAWEKLKRDYIAELAEVHNSLLHAAIPDYSVVNKRHEKDRFTTRVNALETQITSNLRNSGWSQGGLAFGKETDKGKSHIDVVKSGIGLEVTTGKYAFVESDIFVKFPLFLRSGKMNIGIAVVLVRSLASLGIGIVSFEMLQRRIAQVVPFVPRYPFVVIGISNEQLELQVEELASELDVFLFERIGLTYTDLRLQKEQHNCDFKQQLPEQPERIAKELCAFANNHTGGVLLIGVDDDGNDIGIDREELDRMQRRVLGIAKDNCDPAAIVAFRAFEIENHPDRCILAIQINEIERKPCMSQGRIFIRDNATAVPANPEQVRRLLFGSLR